MKTLCSFFIFLFLSTVTLSAQSTYFGEMRSHLGLRFGFGFSTLSGLGGGGKGRESLHGTDFYGYDYSVRYRISYDVGLVYQYEFKNSNFFQIEGTVGVNGAGFKNVYSESMGTNTDKAISRINVSSLMFSAYFGRKFNTENFRRRFILAAGPYFSFNLPHMSGSGGYDDYDYDYDDYDEYGYSTKSEKATKSSGEDVNARDVGFKARDYGITFLAGIEINRFQLTINPQFGLTNILKGNYNVHHRSIKIVGTCFF